MPDIFGTIFGWMLVGESIPRYVRREREREREMKVESLDLSSFSLSHCFRFCPWVSRESLPSDLSNGAFAKNLFPWMLQTPLLVPPALSAWRSGFQAVKSHWKCIDQNDWRLAHGRIHKIALNPEHSFRHPSCAPRSKNHSLSLPSTYPINPQGAHWESSFSSRHGSLSRSHAAASAESWSGRKLNNCGCRQNCDCQTNLLLRKDFNTIETSTKLGQKKLHMVCSHCI